MKKRIMGERAMYMDKSGLALVAIFALAVFLAGCTGNNTTGGNSIAGPSTGRVVFTLTDAATNVQSVSSVRVTVDGVSVHSANQGWEKISKESKTYDLVQLKAEGGETVLTDAQLDAGTYDQVRLDISKVVVTDSSGDHDAKLPSGELKITSAFIVAANQTSTVTFDFIADESLHMTGNGRYIMAPVVNVEMRENAIVEVESAAKNKVRINGNVRSSMKVGMDSEGKVGVGLSIPADAVLNLTSDGKISIRVL